MRNNQLTEEVKFRCSKPFRATLNRFLKQQNRELSDTVRTAIKEKLEREGQSVKTSA